MMDRLRALWKEHLDFAKVRYLIKVNHESGTSGRDADARRPTLRCRINCPAAGGVGISRYRAWNIHLPDTADLPILLRRARIASPKGKI